MMRNEKYSMHHASGRTDLDDDYCFSAPPHQLALVTAVYVFIFECA